MAREPIETIGCIKCGTQTSEDRELCIACDFEERSIPCVKCGEPTYQDGGICCVCKPEFVLHDVGMRGISEGGSASWTPEIPSVAHLSGI